jgi:hypothetical protein
MELDKVGFWIFGYQEFRWMGAYIERRWYFQIS